MQIPQSDILSTNAMNRVFDTTTATYKFYWLLALLDISLEIRFRNNSKLLNIEKEEEPIDIDSLTPDQMKKMLKKMMAQQ